MKTPGNLRPAWAWLGVGVFAIAFAGCGGGGGGGGSGSGVPVSGSTSSGETSTALPSSALQSVDAFVAYMKQLIASTSDTSEPVQLGGAVLPVSDTTETASP